MGIASFLLILSLSALSAAAVPMPHANHTDLQAAINDMRLQSFYGFAILLQMLNSTTQLGLRDVTFFIPQDPQLSNVSIAADRLQDFIFSHFMPMPLQFGDLVRFPTGSIVPSGFHSRMIRIHNHGRGHFAVNNAVITVPNVCSSSDAIKCHGVDAVIDYGPGSYNHEHDDKL